MTLVDLDIRRVADLRRRNPERLYEQLIALRGVHQVGASSTPFAVPLISRNKTNSNPERLKWWNWQDGKTAATTTSPRRRR